MVASNQTVESLIVLLQKAREVLVASLRDKLTAYELTEQQWRVIRVAYQYGALNAQELAAKSAILGPSLSRILHKLQGDGILSRKAAESDLRELTIKLTPAGKRLHNKVNPVVEAHYAKMVSLIGDKKLVQLEEMLNFVIANK